MTTTDLGGIGRYTRAATLTDSILTALDDVARFDMPALMHDYRAKINTVLRGTGISIHGDEFCGEVPVPDNSASLIKDALRDAWAQVDLTAFALPFQHEALTDLAESLGVEASDLMEVVGELHGCDAAQVVNNGIGAVISCLLRRLGAGEVEALIREAGADRADGDVAPAADTPPEPPRPRVLTAAVATSDPITDELLNTLSNAADQQDVAVVRATANDFDESIGTHGVVFTMGTTMPDYDADITMLRQLLTDAGIHEAVFVHVRVVAPELYEKEASGK